MNNEERKAAIFRTMCKEKLAENKSVSQIAKETNTSYIHTKRICEWIKREEKS
jgi:DNA invertase Pin-like site-specific DNA recombinase